MSDQLQRYLDDLQAAKQQELGLQMIQNSLAARAGTNPASTKGVISSAPQQELENYFAERDAERKMAIVEANKAAPKPKQYKTTKLVDASTGKDVFFDPGAASYGYQDDSGNWVRSSKTLEKFPRKGTGKSKKEKPLTANQVKKASALAVGEEASGQYEAALREAAEDYDPTAWTSIIDQIPSHTLGGLIKTVQSDTGQEIQAAENAWVEAYLRDASGAVIGASERQNYARDFFPRAGDTPQIIENKKRLRDSKRRSFEIGAGPAWSKVGEPDVNLVPRSADAPEKTITKKQYSKSRNQTRIIYSDGTIEVLDGRQ